MTYHEQKLYWNGTQFFLEETEDMPYSPGNGTTHIYTVLVPDNTIIRDSVSGMAVLENSPRGRYDLWEVLKFENTQLPKRMWLDYDIYNEGTKDTQGLKIVSIEEL